MAQESIEKLDSIDISFENQMRELEAASDENILALQNGVDPTGKMKDILCGFDIVQNELQREMSATEASEIAGYDFSIYTRNLKFVEERIRGAEAWANGQGEVNEEVRGGTNDTQEKVDGVEQSLKEFKAQLARVTKMIGDDEDYCFETPKKRRRFNFW
jgi:hypothetical protein